MDKREQTCCFTGHRHLPVSEEEAIWQCVLEYLLLLLDQGVHYFGVGGALGFDTLVAEKLLELRRQYLQIRVILVLPFRGYQSRWTSAQQARAARIEDRVDKVLFTAAIRLAVRPFWPEIGIWSMDRPTASVTVQKLLAVRHIHCGTRKSKGYRYGMLRSGGANILLLPICTQDSYFYFV